MTRHPDAGFADFAQRAAPGLRRVGYLLSRDWHRGDDLAQATLERLCASWSRLAHVHDPDAYARRVLTRIFLAEERRLWRRRETSWAEPATAVGAGALTGRAVDGPDAVAERLDVMALLSALPPRQRAAVVLRYLEDRSVEEVAALLDVSTGTVKRSCHDALRRLRGSTEPDADLDADRPVFVTDGGA